MLFGHWVLFMSRYPFASLSSANGFSHPGPKCYEGSPPSSAKEITELKLSQGQWHEKALLPSSYFPVAPDMTLVILARKLLSSPFSCSIRSPRLLLIFSCRCESNGHRHNLGENEWLDDTTRPSGLWEPRDREGRPGHRKVSRDFISDNTGSLSSE